MKNQELNAITEKLQAEWEDIPDGFFWKARHGIMDYERYEYVVQLLEEAKKISLALPGDTFDKSFVKAVWFIPLFLEWQERQIERMGNPIDIYSGQWCAIIENLVSEILGQP